MTHCNMRVSQVPDDVATYGPVYDRDAAPAVDDVIFADKRQGFDTDMLLVGEYNETRERYADLRSALDFEPYEGQRVCIACDYLSKSSSVDVIGVPHALCAEVLYTIG